MKRIFKYILIALVVGVTLVTYIKQQNIESSDITLYQEFSDTLGGIKEKREQQKRIDRRNELKQSIINAHPDLIDEGFEFTGLLVDDELLDKNINVYGSFGKKVIVTAQYPGSDNTYDSTRIYERVIVMGDKKKYFIEHLIQSLNNEPYIYFYETDTKIFLKDLQPFPLVKSFDREILVKDNPEIQRYFLHDLDLYNGKIATSYSSGFSDKKMKASYILIVPVRNWEQCYYCDVSERYKVTLTFNEVGNIIDQEVSKSFFGVAVSLEELPNFDRYITKLPIKDKLFSVEFQKITKNGLSEKIYDISDYVPAGAILESGEYDISKFINDYVESMEAQGYTQKY